MASINLQGDTSGSISIQAPSVAGSNTITLPATTQTLATQNSLGVRNLIINGDMRIAQRGTSSTGLTTSGYNTVDRWTSRIGSAGTWTETQDTNVPSGQGFSNSFKLQCTTANASLSAGALMILQYRLEGQNLQHLKKGTSNAESVTLSFWIKSNKTGTYVVDLYDTDNTRTISKSYTIDTADTWEKKTLTYEGDTTGTLDNDNSRSMDINMWLAAGSDYSSGTLSTSWKAAVQTDRVVGQVNLADSTSNYINITGVQLEVGTEATPFEHRPYDMELARCQRYYQLHDGMIAANGNESVQLYPTISFQTAMRATPSVSQTGTIAFVRPSVANYSQSSVAVSIISATSTAARLSMQNYSGLATNQIYIQATYGEYIQFNSEL
jgi:hypothetical protein